MEKVAKNKRKKGVGLKKAIATGLVLSTLLLPKFMYGSQKSHSPQKERSKISLILEAGKGSESYSAGLGVRFGDIGIGLKGRKYSDKNLYDTEENVFGDVYFKGKKDLEKTTYMGIFAEVYPRILENLSLVLGASGGIKKGTINIEEKLLRGEDELASHETSALKKGFGWDVYAGLIYDFTGNISAGPFVGYGSSKENELGKEGVSFGIKANFKLK